MRLAGIAEIAEDAGVSRQRARQLADKEGFPAPVDTLRMGPVWDRAKVRRWLRRRAAGTTAMIALALLLAGPAAGAAKLHHPDRAGRSADVFVAKPAGTVLALPDGTRGPQPYQRWVDAARVPTVPGGVRLILGPCPGMVEPACAIPGTIWLDIAGATGHGMGSELRYMLFHELGHQADYRVLADADREAFLGLTGDRRPWRSDAPSPHERFAEAYAMCAAPELFPVDRATDRRDGAYGFRPTRRQYRKVCRLVRNAFYRPAPATSS